MRAAIYSRYSTDLQSAASVADQMRLCHERIVKEGWTLAGEYSDAAVSGASRFRPGYQQLLADARSGKFDLVLAEALDRLSRDQEDIAAFYKELLFSSIRLVTLSEGDISELHVGLKGTMNALFLRDLAAKTRRGLRGRIEAGRSAGGRCYGYRVVRSLNADGAHSTGERAIDAVEAGVVRRIFEAFALGKSPRAIAKSLNAEAVPGPNGRPWLDTTLRGHAARGTGLLRNELYIGRLVWNRQRYLKDPASGKRVARINPLDQVIVRDLPDLRILEDELWQRVQGRLEEIAASPAAIAIRRTEFWTKRRPRHLMSGLIVCGSCGSPLASVGKDYLACSRGRRHGLCNNSKSVRRSAIERLILDTLKKNLMQPEHVREFIAAYTTEQSASLRASGAERSDAARRLGEAERKLNNLLEAMADGIRAPGLQGKLDALEAECQRLRDLLKAPPSAEVHMHPNLAELYRREVEHLHEALMDPDCRDEAFAILRSLIECIAVHPGEKGPEIELTGAIVAMVELALGSAEGDRSHSKAAFRRLALDDRSRGSVKVVAGVGFEPTTFRL